MQLVKIKHDISDAFSKEKIGELHYAALKDKPSTYEFTKLYNSQYHDTKGI